MRFNPHIPYNELPELPPAAELETTSVLKACIQARAAVAELDATTGHIPNPTILINTIPMLEARASSEIENIVTTTDRLFRFADDEKNTAADPATKEALRYRTALKHGFDLLGRRPVSTNLALQICTTLRGIQTGIRRLPGAALRNLGTGEAVYTPPEGEAHLRRLLANWETFLHREALLDPLLRMAVGHYQFEAIHPFDDGNGRTGRILNLLFLVEQGLLRSPVLYMSSAIIRAKRDYYRLLLEVTTRQQWEPWLLYMLEVVHETARWTTAKISAIRDLLTRTIEHVQAASPRIYTRELIELLFAQPYCRIENLVTAGLAKRQTASTYLATLVEIGVLEPVQAGRERLFIHRALLNVLESSSEVPARIGSADATPPRAAARIGTGHMNEKARKAWADMNRAGSIDERLRFAIAHKRLMELRYSGKTRVVEPHDYGVQKGAAKLLAFQHGGSGDMHRRSVSGWRLFDVAKIEACAVLDRTFPGSRGALHEHHYVWDELYARVK